MVIIIGLTITVMEYCVDFFKDAVSDANMEGYFLSGESRSIIRVAALPGI